MVNAWSAQAYGLYDAPYPDFADPASYVWRPAQIPDWPHAGLLTTPAFITRWFIEQHRPLA